MNEPTTTPEVLEFLNNWHEYTSAAKSYETNRLNYYRDDRGFIALVKDNNAILNETLEQANKMLRLGEMISATPELAEQAAAYQSALSEYKHAQKLEAERPRAEWVQAKEDLLNTLETAIRSLKIKIGRADSNFYQSTEAEQAEMNKKIATLRAELDLIQLRKEVVGNMRWTNYGDRPFTAELVDEAEADLSKYIAQIFERYEMSLAR